MLPGLHVCCRHLKHRFQPILNSSPDPKKLPPDGASYSASAVFPRVCSICTVSFGDCSEGSGWTRPHGAPDRVDTVAYPEAWQQPLKRGATEMDWAPGTDLLPCSPPPRLKRSRPSQLSSDSSPSPAGYILLACILQLDVDYLPAARAPVWSGVAPERRPGTDFDMWPKISITWDLKTSHIVPAEHTLYHRKSVGVGINPTTSGQMPWNLLTSQTQHHPSAQEVL